ncbi:MAG: hypothetical protein KDD25_04475, partial [Bdellovibrionales bacterium]|nr:hypothetical protein [Bdellovibrionales bacterium]
MKRFSSALMAGLFAITGCSQSQQGSKQFSSSASSYTSQGEVELGQEWNLSRGKNKSMIAPLKPEKTTVSEKKSNGNRLQEINPRAEINRANKKLKPISQENLKIGRFHINNSKDTPNGDRSRNSQIKSRANNRFEKLNNAISKHDEMNRAKMAQAKIVAREKAIAKKIKQKTPPAWDSLRDPKAKSDGKLSFRTKRTALQKRNASKAAREAYAQLHRDGELTKNQNAKTAKKPDAVNGNPSSRLHAVAHTDAKKSAANSLRKQYEADSKNRKSNKKEDVTRSRKVSELLTGAIDSVRSFFGATSAKRAASPKGFDDAYEPNDYISSAYPFYADENVFLSSIGGYGVANDDDYFEIYVDPNYRDLDVDLYGAGSYCGDIDLKVYDEFGSQVASS